MQAIIQFPDISTNVFSFTIYGHDFALRWYALAYLANITATKIAESAIALSFLS